MTDKQKMQADGSGDKADTHDGVSDAADSRKGGGQSGGGAYPSDAPLTPGARQDGKPAPAADNGKQNKP